MIPVAAAGEWLKVQIGEVSQGIYDGPHATPKPAISGPVFLGIRNITDDGRLDLSDVRHISEADYPNWTKRVAPRAGDIVFTYEATLNRYAIIPKGFRGCLGRRLALIRADTRRVDPRFLYYFFFGTEWRATIQENTVPGATVDRIPIIRFPQFPVRVPALEVQRKITGILSAYDDLIENNTRRIKILEEMARALYREWFVRFRFPGHEAVKHVTSQLGVIPDGWTMARLGDLCSDMRRHVHPSEVAPDTPYVGLEHIPRRSIALTHWGAASGVDSTKLIFRKGEILFGKIRPYFHKVAVAPVDGLCSSDAIVISPKAREWFPLVLACVSSDEFVQHATQTSNGTKYYNDR